MSAPPASIVIPTRARPAYLEVALGSIAPQAAAHGADVVVVEDGRGSVEVREIARRFGAHHEPLGSPQGLNAARNRGVSCTQGELVVFTDDDVRASPQWLEALLRAAQAHPRADVLTGPIRPSLEGRAPRSCGREAPPITSLDLGPRDARARFAWGANMAIRRAALQRAGGFDATLGGAGDEQELQERLARPREPSALYVARAAVEHRRAGEDARLRSLMAAAHQRGRAARRFDARRGCAPTLARELLTLAGCAAHVLRRACPAGLTMVAHSAGRVREAILQRSGRAKPTRETEDFLSGTSGTSGGLAGLARRGGDGALDAWELLSGRAARLRRASEREPARRRVLVLGVKRSSYRLLAARAHAELRRSRHHVEIHTVAPGDAGKFENLNRLLASHPPHAHDWLLVLDDDVELSHGFLDRFLFLCERFSLQLAQPAHRWDSHAAWPQTRRRTRLVAHETSFVEIGPLTAFARHTFDELLPFPALRMGWGLDNHWAAVARERGWRCGVIDAVTIRHRAAPAASAYPRERAIAEARAFLAERPYLTAEEARRTLATHRRW